MRIPVFARGANPAIDRPNLRKSVSYGEAEVLAGRADWVDPNDYSRGILCREFLYSGEKLKPAQPEQVDKLRFRSSLPPVEVDGTRFKDPFSNSLSRGDRVCLLVRARAFARYCDLQAVTA